MPTIKFRYLPDSMSMPSQWHAIRLNIGIGMGAWVPVLCSFQSRPFPVWSYGRHIIYMLSVSHTYVPHKTIVPSLYLCSYGETKFHLIKWFFCLEKITGFPIRGIIFKVIADCYLPFQCIAYFGKIFDVCSIGAYYSSRLLFIFSMFSINLHDSGLLAINIHVFGS